MIEWNKMDLILLVSEEAGDGTHASGKCIAISATAATSAATAALLGLGGVRHGLGHQFEGSFFGDIAKSSKVLDRLLSCGMLFTRNDASLVLHEILFL